MKTPPDSIASFTFKKFIFWISVFFAALVIYVSIGALLGYMKHADFKRRVIEAGQSWPVTEKRNPETCICKHLGFDVPENAVNIECVVQSLMVKWVYARFDIPAGDLSDLLLEKPLDKLPAATKNPELLEELQTYASNIPWWDTETAKNIDVAQSSWITFGYSSDWSCCLSFCMEQKLGWVTVYVQYYEEPVSKGSLRGK